MTIYEPGPAIALEQVEALERAVGKPFPSSFREFLLKYNGGRPMPSSFDVLGHEERTFDVQVLYGVSRPIESSNIGWNFEVLRHTLGADRVSFGCTDTDDQLILDLRDGSVWFWDFAESDPRHRFYRAANSHGEFLASLRERDQM